MRKIGFLQYSDLYCVVIMITYFFVIKVSTIYMNSGFYYYNAKQQQSVYK